MWIDTHRTEYGYEVRSAVRGDHLGWLTYDQPFTQPWRAWCGDPACHEIGGAQTRDQAAELVRRHNAEVHP